MLCRHCGADIDTKNRNPDGTVVCPGCGTAYRRKGSAAGTDLKARVHPAPPSAAAAVPAGPARKTGGRVSRIERKAPDRPAADIGAGSAKSKLPSQPDREPPDEPKKRKGRSGRLLLVLLVIFASLVAIGGIGFIVYDLLTQSEDAGGGLLPELSALQRLDNNQASKTPTATEYIIRDSAMHEICLDGCTFQDGVAWALLSDPAGGKDRLGLISTAAEVIYLLDEARFACDAAELVVTPFISGTSVVYIPQRPGFLVVDTRGNAVLDSRDENLYMCGKTSNGLFLLARHDPGVSGDTWQICTLDSSLNVTDTGVVSDGSILPGRTGMREFACITEGLYCCREEGTFLNLLNRSYYPTWDGTRSVVYYGSYESYAVMAITATNTYFLPVERLVTAASGQQLLDMLEHDSASILYPCHLETHGREDDYFYSSFRGLSLYHVRGTQPVDYLDPFGNPILTFPAFTGGNRYDSTGDFSGGFAPLYLIGADGNRYISLIDESGTLQYNPVMEPASYGSTKSDAGMGCVFLTGGQEDGLTIIDQTGRTLKAGDALPLSPDSRFLLANIGASVGCGCLLFNDCIYALDGSRSFHTVTAALDRSGNLIRTP